MLRIQDLALARAGRTLFRGLSLAAGAGDRVGVLGPNGCGKSSLLAALAGRLEPEAGTIELPGPWTLATARQDTPRGSENALAFVMAGDRELDQVRQALAAAEAAGDGERQAGLHDRLGELAGYDAEARACALLAGLGFPPDAPSRPLDRFSGGWRARLGLARAMFAVPDLLLLDEPTNHLDLPTIDWLADWLLRFPGLLLCVSHDRYLLDRISTQVLWLDPSGPRFFQGNLSVAEARRSQLLAAQARRRERDRREAERLQGFIDRFRAKASKARQAQSRLKRLERLQITAPLAAYAGYHFRFPDPPRTDAPLLSLDHADLGYGDVPVLAGVHLSILPGDRLGLLGRNGAGKSTLMKALAGLLPAPGRHAGRHLQVGYFAQHQLDQLDPESSPLAHLRRLDPEAPEQALRDFLGGFGFHGDHAVEPVGPRSGGERARLALALLAWERPNLLLLDEPTNHLDLEMRDALALALQAFGGAVVLVSHDRAFLESLADCFLLVADGRVQPWQSPASELPPATVAPGAGADGRERPPEDRRRRRQQAAELRARLQPLRAEAARLEQAMARTGDELAVLREQLSDPGFYAAAGSEEQAEQAERCGRLERELEQLEERWLEAQEALEAASAPGG